MGKNDNMVLYADLTNLITVHNAKEILSQVLFDSISQKYWITTRNNTFIKAQKYVSDRIVELDSILSFKDAGINYQRVKVGLSQKGKSDLSSRLLYEGVRKTRADVEYWKGIDINSFFISEHTSRYCRSNISLKENERVILNKDYFCISPKLIWRQTASYPVCAIDYRGVWFGRSIQAGLIKSEYADKVSYEYLCGILNSNYIRNIYEQNVKEGGRVFPQVKLEKLKVLPIAIPDSKIKKTVENLVTKIIKGKLECKATDKFEKLLNNEVDKLYNEI